MILGSNTHSKRTVTKETVKICALCGALNHQRNSDCWTCGWHGVFTHEARTVDLAWQRLESLYEEVRLEHVTRRSVRALGDFGLARPASFWSGLLYRIRGAWERFQTHRDLRMAQRAAALRSRTPSRPDQLGV